MAFMRSSVLRDVDKPNWVLRRLVAFYRLTRSVWPSRSPDGVGFRLGETVANTGESSSDGACIFCMRGDLSLNRVLIENRTFYVRYDNFPATDGHVEIVPKRHVESFFDLSPREVRDAYALIQAARTVIDETTSAPHGYTIGVNEGRAAGRTIDHLHIHLIPRREGDVPDPRGGVRQVVPKFNPDAWALPYEASEGRSAKTKELASSLRPSG